MSWRDFPIWLKWGVFYTLLNAIFTLLVFLLGLDILAFFHWPSLILFEAPIYGFFLSLIVVFFLSWLAGALYQKNKLYKIFAWLLMLVPWTTIPILSITGFNF